ncbi:SDR family NAD(P)-dependent oxidoreductase [Fodinibius sp.]|uniref:SDR family NAD(P)-dependent oxidoreductase n=1 Tax=Fodinibius sp. TaxID=1872440 RepID=UPI002ACE0D72|nr:SDR family NAD(P)-dependent oxidoreductase [Fodinibius sp.]MDZ7658714.1 SDR family NAD(P)-dependent oxidoreductase [Fodinibius sp.]
MDFSDGHIIITGGAGSLGTAVVQLLIDEGAKCSVPCFNQDELDSFEFSDHDDVFTKVGVDLTDEDQAQSFFEDAIASNGPLWGSIHIAGGFGMGAIEDTDKAGFMKQINMNLVTCYNSCRAAVQHFKDQGNGGRIVNIAARPALEPRQGAGMTAYTTSKAGVAALTESLAAEVVEDDILVNAIAPSVIDTPQNREGMPNADFDKWPKPEQLARQIAYLVSPENEVTRGSIVTVYGKS